MGAEQKAVGEESRVELVGEEAADGARGAAVPQEDSGDVVLQALTLGLDDVRGPAQRTLEALDRRLDEQTERMGALERRVLTVERYRHQRGLGVPDIMVRITNVAAQLDERANRNAVNQRHEQQEQERTTRMVEEVDSYNYTRIVLKMWETVLLSIECYLVISHFRVIYLLVLIIQLLILKRLCRW